MTADPRHPGASALLRPLREALRRRGLTAKSVAGHLRVSEPTIHRWLRGRGLTLDHLDQLCELAGLELRDLVASLPERGATRFTLAQERALAANRALAFLFFSILNGVQPDVFEREFGLQPCRVRAFVETLRRIGLVDTTPHGGVRALTARGVTWRPGGPLAVAFNETVKPLFLSMDLGAESAEYVADMVRLSSIGRGRVQALFAALRLDIHRLAEEDRAARLDHYDWSAVLMLVRQLDMDEVVRGAP